MEWNKIVKKAGWVVFDWEKFFVVERDMKNYNDISLPKWHIDPWENAEQAALREVLEETWLECQILKDLWTVMYENNEWLVEVRYYAMKVKRIVTDQLFPDVTGVITGSYSEIVEKLSYDTDKLIFKKWAKFFESYKNFEKK